VSEICWFHEKDIIKSFKAVAYSIFETFLNVSKSCTWRFDQFPVVVIMNRCINMLYMFQGQTTTVHCPIVAGIPFACENASLTQCVLKYSTHFAACTQMPHTKHDIYLKTIRASLA